MPVLRRDVDPYLLTKLPWFAPPLCRLGLATRGNTHLDIADVYHALDRGVNFLNWCGQPDALSGAIASLGARRSEVALCVQFEARTAVDADKELRQILQELRTDYVDVLTFYYVEAASEWDEIAAAGGALEYCRAAQRRDAVRRLGLTSHQRPLAAQIARSGLIDLLMIRYNAAHRGAEQDVFPVTGPANLPVVVYTCLRWGALLQQTPDDPTGFRPPSAPDWYRFDLQAPAATVALMAPDNRQELDEDLQVLQSGPLTAAEYDVLASHGQRVRRHAGSFP
jgi:predicted aldo/keto reductase-like oxidoreductase